MIDISQHQELVKLLHEPSALCLLSWGRDTTDNYTCSVQSLNGATVLNMEELSPLLPSGSKWLPAKGWRSIFGMPFLLKGEHYITVGVESIYPHPRGAFPVLDAYIYPGNTFPYDSIAAVINFIKANGNEVEPSKSTHGIMNTTSKTPTEHKLVEIEILCHALASYQRHERLLFITLLLSEDRLTMPGFPGPLSKMPGRGFSLEHQNYLLATAPSILSTFSFLARSWAKAFLRLR